MFRSKDLYGKEAATRRITFKGRTPISYLNSAGDSSAIVHHRQKFSQERATATRDFPLLFSKSTSKILCSFEKKSTPQEECSGHDLQREESFGFSKSIAHKSPANAKKAPVASLESYFKNRKRAVRSNPNAGPIIRIKKNVVYPGDENSLFLKRGKIELHKESDNPKPLQVKQENFLLDRAPHNASKGEYRAPCNKVRETLRAFRDICDELQRGEKVRRVDLHAARILKNRGMHINMREQSFGPIAGIEVGQRFCYRMEMAVIGLHRLPESGIDYVNHRGRRLATSVVASGIYEEDDTSHPDELVYVGQGGRVSSRSKEPEDQVLERGNLALKNSIGAENPVRVIRRIKVGGSCGRMESYVYDGVYRVTSYWVSLGQQGKNVYKFHLERIPD